MTELKSRMCQERAECANKEQNVPIKSSISENERCNKLLNVRKTVLKCDIRPVLLCDSLSGNVTSNLSYCVTVCLGIWPNMDKNYSNCVVHNGISVYENNLDTDYTLIFEYRLCPLSSI